MATETKSANIAPTAYPQMIMAAIKELNEKNGSTKADISKHMENIYPDLPPAHPTLLSNHLDNLKESGELVFAKNCYVIPDPNVAPKRGRGRPPKEKTDEASAKPATPGKPRGRPPKAKEGDSAPVSGAKPRGRPPKAKEAADVGDSEAKRPRGRPPKKAKVDEE